ncbi:hypothetical protein M758_6G054800 [Ceratodon purpureus]|uniref:Uncharacterized protein n=1 Tax=Ceratodon purpureus TaxID=3225 RepID=A0A8T0HC13_CERPU|nr:hypothetical protein KC19_6G058600 [Ceratodon purpureus]KAG0612822.1 hypothetical protein M758_6G054800 [Ceratodon purpureus]
MYGVAANHYVLETGQGLSLGQRAGTPLSGAASPQLTRSRWTTTTKHGRSHRLIAALDPAFPNQNPDLTDFQWPSTSRAGRQGETEREVKAGAKEKWSKDNQSALSGDTPLPLPLAYPGTEPLSQKQVDDMMSCDPELEYCKDPVYQWTTKCTRCQGTGEVSFFRKRGKEVISKCIACVGIGYVERISLRADKVDDSDLSK